MKCSDIMKKDVICVRPTDTVQHAARLMRDEGIGFLPVCDEDGRALGAITDRDIVVRIVADGHPGQTTVREAMTQEVVACKADDDVRLVERMMARNQKARMMVIDHVGRLVGVISLSDVVERETDAARAARTAREVSRREIRGA